MGVVFVSLSILASFSYSFMEGGGAAPESMKNVSCNCERRGEMGGDGALDGAFGGGGGAYTGNRLRP